MAFSNILEDVISRIQPEDLPIEYIVLAKVTDSSGVERILRGADVTHFLNNPNRAQGVSEARVILDMSKIRRAIIEAMSGFFADLNARIQRLDPTAGRADDDDHET